jgi:hypothetical protein
MATTFQNGDVVKYMFGENVNYEVIATKEQPKIRKGETPLKVPDGYDYLIIKSPVEECTPFFSVNEDHIELISAR